MKKILFSLIILIISIVFFETKVSAKTFEKDEEYQTITITTEDTINTNNYIKAHIIFTSKDYYLEQDCKIKIRGNSTSEFWKSPYNIKFDEKQEIFGLPKTKKICLLANFLDKTLIRNKLALDFGDSTSLKYTTKSTFVEVYVNNTYMGNYLLTQAIRAGKNDVNINEKGNEFIIEKEFSREEEGVTYFSTPILNYRFSYKEPEIPTIEQSNYLMNLLTNVENALLSKDKDEIEKYIDIDSFIDFYIINELFKNLDFNYSSTYYYVKENKLYAGPIWDFDLSMGNVSIQNNKPYNNINENNESIGESYIGSWAFNAEWAREFLACDEILEMVYNRYVDLQTQIKNLYEDNSLEINKIDKLVNDNKTSINRNLELFPLIKGEYNYYDRPMDATYEENINFLKDWLKNRNEWILNDLKEKTSKIEKKENNAIKDKENIKEDIKENNENNENINEGNIIDIEEENNSVNIQIIFLIFALVACIIYIVLSKILK